MIFCAPNQSDRGIDSDVSRGRLPCVRLCPTPQCPETGGPRSGQQQCERDQCSAELCLSRHLARKEEAEDIIESEGGLPGVAAALSMICLTCSAAAPRGSRADRQK